MKKYLILAILSFVSMSLTAQEYFVFQDEEKIYSKGELDKQIANKNTEIKKSLAKDATHRLLFNYKILNTKRKGDSIINIIRYDFKFESTKNEGIYALENKKLPELNLRNLESRKIKLEDLNGKVTLINLWFTRCHPCIKEIPLLNTLQSKYNDDVNFVAITFDSKERVQSFLQKKMFKFEHLVNAKSYLQKDLGVNAYPKIVILDKQGIVRYIGDGIPVDYDYTEQKVIERDEKDLAYLEEILDNLLN